MHRFLVLAVLALLTDCSDVANNLADPEGAIGGQGRVNASGANQLFPANFENLTAPTSYDGPPTNIIQSAAGGLPSSNPTETCKSGDSYAAVTACIAAQTADPNGQKAVRNAVVGQLLAASDQRCNLYFTYLINTGSDVQGTFSVLSTVFGGLGAIFTPVDTVRALSGLAGISSGVGGNLQTAIFQQTAISVIIPAIKSARETEHTKIDEDMTKSYSDWDIPQAVDEVIYYHGLCNIELGIASAQAKIASTSPTGTTTTTAYTQTDVAAGKLLFQGHGDPGAVNSYEIIKVANGMVTYTQTTPAGIVTSATAPMDVFLSAVNSVPAK